MGVRQIGIYRANAFPWGKVPPVRTLAADEGKTCTGFREVCENRVKADPHPTSLRSATFPRGKALLPPHRQNKKSTKGGLT